MSALIEPGTAFLLQHERPADVGYGSGTPQPIIDLLQAQVGRIMQLPDIKQRIDTMGWDATHTSSAEFAALMKSETEKWTKVIRDTKIKID